MSWINSGTDRETTLACLPALADKFQALYDSLWAQPHLPAATLELCRLRLAQLHHSGADGARSDYPIPPLQRQHLADWASHPAFSDAERACLEFTEVYAMDCAAITDPLADAVKAHHGDAGLVALIEALGLFDGLTRLSLLWQLPTPAPTTEECA